MMLASVGSRSAKAFQPTSWSRCGISTRAVIASQKAFQFRPYHPGNPRASLRRTWSPSEVSALVRSRTIKSGLFSDSLKLVASWLDQTIHDAYRRMSATGRKRTSHQHRPIWWPSSYICGCQWGRCSVAPDTCIDSPFGNVPAYPE